MRYKLAFSICALMLGGCASSQINYNTLDIANASRDLLTKQIVANFAAFVSSDTVLPAQLVINSGSTSTTNTAGGSVSSPLSAMVQSTFSVASAATSTITNSHQSSTAGSGLSLSATNVAGETYAFDTITDYEKMHRLNALYRYAISWSELEEATGEAKFIDEFPLYRKSVSHSRTECTAGYDQATGRVAAPVFQNTGVDAHNRPQTLTFCATSATTSGNYSHSGGSEQFTTQVPDETYLSYPTCIVCGRPSRLEMNRHITGPWLLWRDLTGGPVPPARTVGPADHPIGSAGRYEFYVRSGHEDSYVQFAMAILAASTQTSSAVQGGAGGGGASSPSGAAPKAPAPYELTIPVVQ